MSSKSDKTVPMLDISCRLRAGESEGEGLARMVVDPHARHGFVTHVSSGGMFPNSRPKADDLMAALDQRAVAVAAGDLRAVSDLMLFQAQSLDTLFTDFSHRALANNQAGHLDAFNKYLNLALKCQAQSRATIEALARMHQPREQTVIHKHIHIGANGQAVVAEEFHHHGPGVGNAGIAHQPHAASAALSSPNAIRHTLPVAEGPGAEALPNARRGKGERRADRQPERPQARPQVAGGSRAKGAAQGSVSGGAPAVNTAEEQREQGGDG